MNAHKTYKLALPLLLFLSLPLKAWGSLGRAADLKETMRSAIAAFVQSNSFQVVQVDETNTALRAISNGCEMVVVYVSPKGDHRDKVQNMARNAQDFFYVYQGALYQDQPVWDTRLDYYVFHILSFFRMRDSFKSTLAVMTAQDCPMARQLPWNEIADVPIHWKKETDGANQ